MRAWLVAGLDEDAQRVRKGRLAGALYLAADLYAAVITAQTWPDREARISQSVLVALVAVLAVTLLFLPWRRFSDSVLLWPVLPSAFLTTLGEGYFGVLDHYHMLYVLALGYAGLVLRPGRTALLAGLDLVLLGVVGLTGREPGHLAEIAGTILASALIGELIAAATATQRRQLTDLERLHVGLRPLLTAQSEPEAATRISDLAADLLRADGVATLVTEPEGAVQTVRGGARGGAGSPGIQVSSQPGTPDGIQDGILVDGQAEASGIGVVARTRQPLFVPDARHDPRVSRTWVEHFGCASILYVPILAGDRLAGTMVIWWTTPAEDLDHFAAQVVELLSLQAGPVLERVRQVEELDRAATTDSLTGWGHLPALQGWGTSIGGPTRTGCGTWPTTPCSSCSTWTGSRR